MSTIRALLLVIAVLVMATVGQAAERGQVIEIRYGYNQKDKNSQIDTSSVDTAFYKAGTKVEIIKGNKNSPEMFVRVIEVSRENSDGPIDSIFVRPASIGNDHGIFGGHKQLDENILVIRQKPARPEIRDALVGSKIFAWLRDRYVQDIDSLIIAVPQGIVDSLENASAVALRKAIRERRQRFESDSAGFANALGVLPDSLKKGLAVAVSGKGDSAPVREEVSVAIPDPVASVQPEVRITMTVKSENTPISKAVEIMGSQNVHDWQEAMKVFGLESFDVSDTATVPFSEATLRECAGTHYLIADLGLSIEEMRSRKPAAFYRYANGDGEPAAHEVVKPHWRLVRKISGPVGSWPKQLSSLKSYEGVSLARAVVYDALVLNNLSGFVRTSSLSRKGSDQHLVIGRSDGLIWIYPGFDRNDRLPVVIPSNEINLAICRK